MTTVLSAVPIIPARDLAATTAWYRDSLGFTRRHIEEEYGIVERDGVELHFWGPSGIEPQNSMTMYRLGIDGIDALYEICERAGLVHPNAALEAKHWGTREFALGDCDGNLVTFFERPCSMRKIIDHDEVRRPPPGAEARADYAENGVTSGNGARARRLYRGFRLWLSAVTRWRARRGRRRSASARDA